MPGVSSISGIPGGTMPVQANPTRNVGGAPATATPGEAAAGSVSASQSLGSLSSTSTSTSVQSLVGTDAPVLADEDLLGLVLLLLTLEYLQGEDDEEKQGLLALMLLLSQQQGGSRDVSLTYASSLLSVESTGIQAMSTEGAVSAYSGGTANPQQAPAVDPGAGGGIDVVA